MENDKNNRKGEQATPHFRSGRFYSIANEWYFSVREQQDQGPFPTKESAEENLKIYLADYAHFGMSRGSFDINKLKIN
ncbi:MAG: DUF6316 family protein [Draconibacterium sp.]|nr:DUF6316 family protein [Draconibacterium sp.]